MKLTVKCIKSYPNKKIKVGSSYPIVDADMMEYLIDVDGEYIWISKNDITHFKYKV